MRYKPKTQRRAYYVNETGKISTKKLSKLEYFIFKYFKKKWKRRKQTCEKCENSFTTLIKKSSQKVECPYC